MVVAPAHLLHVFPTLERGGAQLRTGELMRFAGAAFRHTVVALDGGATVAAGAAWLPAAGALEILPKRGSWQTMGRLRGVLRRTAPDLVLTYDWGAIDAVVAHALTCRAPLLHHEDGFGDDERRRTKPRRNLARRLALRHADRVVVPSRGLHEWARRVWAVPTTRLVRIPNGVDTTRFAPRSEVPAWRRRLPVPLHAPLIGTVGRLAQVKNVRRLLESFARVHGPSAPHLVVAGEGPESAELGALARALGIAGRVHWLGFVPRPEEIYPALDVFALASDSEQLPRALLEAMASGCAVAATAVGDVPVALPEAQRPYLASLAGTDGVAALAESMCALLHRPEERRALGRANRDRVRAEFSADDMLQRYLGLYQCTIEKTVAAAPVRC